ncbi:ORF75 [Ranid herpesvirus 1]|uniref:ORF75 n=1 Tax=Ranid herpesvirus 1 TaxID=85655 RepID=Q9YQZ3_9VIRU|nr:ORF75 [Ranid herpesvirus 1]AAD12272.1 ORF75 [Ranid herpesvirus 1]
MGIQKHFVQALVAQAVLGLRDETIYQVHEHMRVEDCDVLIYDHNILLHKAMARFAETEDTTPDVFIEELVSLYLKYPVSSKAWIIALQDGASFGLKVAARQRRSARRQTAVSKMVSLLSTKLFEDAYDRLCARRGSAARVIAVSGVRPSDAESSYTVHCTSTSVFATTVCNSLGCAEVEADIMQMRVGVGVAAAYPNMKIGILTIDTDIPMIATAMVNMGGIDMPPNLRIFFQTQLLQHAEYMGRIYRDCHVPHLSKGTRHSDAMRRLTEAQGDEEGTLRYVLDDANVSLDERGVWRDLAREFGTDFQTMGTVFARTGVRGPLAARLLRMYFYDTTKERAKRLLELMGKSRTKPTTAQIRELLYIGVPDLESGTHEVHNTTLHEAYRAGRVSFNTYGRLRSMASKSYVPLMPQPASAHAYAVVLLAVIGGTDYNVPLHQFGLKQLVCAAADPTLQDRMVKNYEKLSGHFLRTQFLPQFTSLRCEAGYDDVWNALAALTRVVVRGWTKPGYFLSLYHRVLQAEGRAVEGYVRIPDSNAITFAIADRLADWKKAVRISAKRKVEVV